VRKEKGEEEEKEKEKNNKTKKTIKKRNQEKWVFELEIEMMWAKK